MSYFVVFLMSVRKKLDGHEREEEQKAGELFLLHGYILVNCGLRGGHSHFVVLCHGVSVSRARLSAITGCHKCCACQRPRQFLRNTCVSDGFRVHKKAYRQGPGKGWTLMSRVFRSASAAMVEIPPSHIVHADCRHDSYRAVLLSGS